MGSVLSRPSTVTLLERPRCPVNESPLVAAAPCNGVRSVATPGAINAKPMKLRPLIGSDWICCCWMTDAIVVRFVESTDAGASTVTASVASATVNVKSIVEASPSSSVMASRVCGLKPDNVALTVYVPGGSAGTA